MWDLQVMRLFWWVKAAWKDCTVDSTMFNTNFCSIILQRIVSAPRLATWQPPPLSRLKFNVDGTSQGNSGSSGVGGVLRDHLNRVLGYVSINSGFGWAFEAEVRAILKALMFCQEFLFKEVEIESDSTTTVG